VGLPLRPNENPPCGLAGWAYSRLRRCTPLRALVRSCRRLRPFFRLVESCRSLCYRCEDLLPDRYYGISTSGRVKRPREGGLFNDAHN